MIVVCNKCDTRYRLDKELILEEGSEVRCSQCEYIWFQKRETIQQFADSFVSALSKNERPRTNKFSLEPAMLFLILILLTMFAFKENIARVLYFLLS